MENDKKPEVPVDNTPVETPVEKPVEKKRPRRSGTPSKYVPASKKSYGWLWGVLVVIVVAVVVAVGIAMGVKSTRQENSGADITLHNATVKVTEEYIQFASNDVVAKPKVLEMFEDPRCPGCAELEKLHGGQLAEAIESNKVVLRLHLMDFLNSQGPTQYSMRANAALLAVAATGDAEATFRYHAILWHTAPAEGAGVVEPNNADLADKAKQAGADGDVVDAIRKGQYPKMRSSGMARENLKELNDRMNGQGGTPAAFVNGKQVDTSNPSWVTDLYPAKKD